IALRGGRIRPQVVVIEALASAACIGSGGSAGREGPIVQIGSALGSVTGQFFHLSTERIRSLVACGAAAGIAAVFNAPIAGTIFAMEVILGEFTTSYFGNVVICAVTASIVSRQFLGNTPAFAVPSYSMISPWEIVFYTILGVLCALGAWLFVTSLYWFEDKFDEWKFAEWAKPAVGGLMLGALALFLPDVLGSGLEFIEQALHGDLLWPMMALLVFGKMLATNFTLGSGNSGGVFAPSLYMGAMLGGAFGSMAHYFFPAITAPYGAYALVGMAALFAAATHAPITGVIIVFEMSGDYRLILPLMFATVISTLISERLRKENIYTLKLVRRGIQLKSGRDVDVLQSVSVDEVMRTNLDTVSPDLTLSELLDLLSRTHHHGLPVLDRNGELWGIVTVTDVDRALAANVSRQTTVSEIGTPRSKLVLAYPDETIDEVLARMSTRGLGRMPVVARENPAHLVGMVRRADIIRSYTLALSRRAKKQHHTRRMQLRNIDGTEFIDITLTNNDRAVGKSVSELAGKLPDECILISIRRDGRVLIPHGHTKFQPGDHITAFIRTKDSEKLHQCLRGEQPLLKNQEILNGD
ncbi:MAG: CBS domain-containing protein, partial [Chloroflexi bacterium]